MDLLQLAAPAILGPIHQVVHASMSRALTHLSQLEAEAIFILREIVAEFHRPVLLYSVGKDSSVLLHLAKKAFYPGPLPFPLLHVDTGYKFPEMYRFRDQAVRDAGAELIVHRNETAIMDGAHPAVLGTGRCCALLKTQALLSALNRYQVDCAIGGARRDEEASRAKERVYSVRDAYGQWDPRRQRPEPWSLLNGCLAPGESIRAFPLSNWTELDVWQYIHREGIAVVPLYLAEERPVIRRGGQLIPLHQSAATGAGDEIVRVWCRFRTLGCVPCTGAVESRATTIPEVMAELARSRQSERATRVIDHDAPQSMEAKKREGYF